MAASASASAPPGAPRRRGSADVGAQVEQLCCVCHLPADPVRKLAPLRRGYFVHYDCERSWTDSRDRGRCELCDRKAQRLSVWEFMAGLPAKLTSLLLPLFFAVCAVGETAIHLITLQTWHLLFASTFAQAHYLVTLRLSATSIIASASFFAAFANRFAPFAVAPFARWVKRLETRCQGWWGIDGWQVLALFTVEACLVRFKLLIAPSFDSMALHWFTGRNILSLRPRVFVFLRKVLKPGIMIRFVKHNIREPFYIFYFKRLPGLFDDIAFIALVVLVPTKIAVQLTPEVFPLDITYFDRPAKGTSFWQGPRYYAEALSGILYLKFLVDNTVLYLEWLVWRVRCYWLFTVGDALWNIVSPREHYDRSDEVNNRRRFVVVQTMPQVVLSWLAVAIFNSVMLLSSISIGRTFVFAVPELPLRGQMKSNDLFAIATGFGVVSIVIAASRDAFVRVAYGGTRLVALEMHLIFFIWILFIPLWIGLLVDLSLLSPFIGPGSDVPVLDFFCTWSLGRITQIYGTKLARRYKVKGGLPSLADSIENYWTGDKLESLSKIGSFATKLVAALVVPYVLAKGVFPRLGYPAAVNSMVYHFAWLGCIALYAVCYLAKVACTMLHDSIRDDRQMPANQINFWPKLVDVDAAL
ncbi:hypothetical protein D1007_54477 [Hordeum vulgare]|nr:hypothetical protein D1007_54477 [Hordeum vulgare]